MASTQTSDLDEFIQLGKPPRKACAVNAALTNGDLSVEDKRKLQAALDADRIVITSSVIVQWLAQRGVETNRQLVGNHRRGVCSCA